MKTFCAMLFATNAILIAVAWIQPARQEFRVAGVVVGCITAIIGAAMFFVYMENRQR